MIFILWTLGIVCAVVFLVAGLHFHRTARVFVRNNADGVKIALLVGAALYTALVYNREATDNRIANTLAFKERTESGELRKAFEAIDMMWIRSEVKWDLDRFRRQVANTRDCNVRFHLHKNFAQDVTELVESQKLEDEIFVIHGFYKDINICVRQGRCHEPTACELFVKDMRNFQGLYVGFLIEWDRLWDTGIIQSLEGFYTRCKDYLPASEEPCPQAREPTNSFGEIGRSP